MEWWFVGSLVLLVGYTAWANHRIPNDDSYRDEIGEGFLDGEGR